MSDDDDWDQQYRSDPRSTDDLIRLVLTKDADDDDYWYPVWILQHRLPEIMMPVSDLIKSSDAKSRETAATILGQNGVKNKRAVSQCVNLLAGMIHQETDVGVLSSIAFAMGHLHDPRCIEEVLSLTQHPNADVRYAVVHSLTGHEDPKVIEAMIALSDDDDPDVRNWATFGIGSMIETDIPALREALFERLSETEQEIRLEAIVGLAQRGDIRIVVPLLDELNKLESESPENLRKWDLVHTACESILPFAQGGGDDRWLPVLEKFKTLGFVSGHAIQETIDQCRKSSP